MGYFLLKNTIKKTKEKKTKKIKLRLGLRKRCS